MGVAEEEASMTFEQFMQGMAGREEILGRWKNYLVQTI
jgi:hypothetical protein